MKRALLAATALVTTSFAPIPMITTAAHAANPTLADAQTVCNDLYVNNQADPSLWKAEVTDFHSEDGPTTQVDGSERNINYRADTGGTFAYAGFVRADNPLSRTGGSPNMWGQAVFSQKIYDNTLYDVEADFMHTVTYSWTCHVSQLVTTTVGGGNGGDNGGGSGNNGQNNGLNEQNGGNGNGNNGCGNGNGGPNPDGNPNSPPGCNGGHTVTNWEFVADYTDNTAQGDDVDEGYSTIATDQQLAGHVDGVNYTEYGNYTPDGIRALACISPGKKGGSWTAKNNYTGGQCSTATFNAAPTLYGTTFDTPPTASLPAY